MRVSSLLIAPSVKIPQVGLGLWQVKEVNDFTTAFAAALEAGYRHFDTAQAYGNEQFLGRAWKQSGVARDKLFITTKIGVENFGHKRTLSSFAESLDNLHTDYVDLLLLHFPVSFLRCRSWAALEEIKAAGGARAIGVSNYTVRHLKEMELTGKIMPAVNQVELHVFLQQPKLVEYCKARGIVLEAYSPLAHGRDMRSPIVQRIAEKHGKSYVQVMLRWCIQQGFVALPKSLTPARIRENIAVFDFELDDADMQELTAADKHMRTCWDPTLVP